MLRQAIATSLLSVMMMAQNPIRTFKTADLNNDGIKEIIEYTVGPASTVDVHEITKDPMLTYHFRIRDGKTGSVDEFFINAHKLTAALMGGLKQPVGTDPLLDEYPDLVFTDEYDRRTYVSWNGTRYQKYTVSYDFEQGGIK